jgi:hypothetical protein
LTLQRPISLHVNGERVDAQVLPQLNLLDFLRAHRELTVTNAVNDALRPFGSMTAEIPLTPQVILAALGRI